MTKDEFLEKYERRNFSVEWTTGGMSGGNCWGDSANYSVEADPEPDFDVLDEILMEICPSITLKEFRMIMKDPDLVEFKTWDDYEYYGNYYSKASKQANLEVLWKYVKIMIDIPDPNVRLTHYKLMEE